MIIQIKKILLENNFQPMTATKQNLNKKLTPISNINKGIDPSNNASLQEVKTKATSVFKKPGNLAIDLIRDSNKIITKEQTKG